MMSLSRGLVLWSAMEGLGVAVLVEVRWAEAEWVRAKLESVCPEAVLAQALTMQAANVAG